MSLRIKLDIMYMDLSTDLPQCTERRPRWSTYPACGNTPSLGDLALLKVSERLWLIASLREREKEYHPEGSERGLLVKTCRALGPRWEVRRAKGEQTKIFSVRNMIKLSNVHQK